MVLYRPIKVGSARVFVESSCFNQALRFMRTCESITLNLKTVTVITLASSIPLATAAFSKPTLISDVLEQRS